MEARGAAGSAATRRCVRRPRLQRARCDFVDFFRCTPRDLGPIGHGAPPQAHIHLNLEVYISGSPRTKFGVFVTVCNRRFHMLDHLFGASLPVRRIARDHGCHEREVHVILCTVQLPAASQKSTQGLHARRPAHQACTAVNAGWWQLALGQNFVLGGPKFHLENSTLRHPNLMKISLKFEAR
jgi:hypothetical protein